MKSWVVCVCVEREREREREREGFGERDRQRQTEREVCFTYPPPRWRGVYLRARLLCFDGMDLLCMSSGCTRKSHLLQRARIWHNRHAEDPEGGAWGFQLRPPCECHLVLSHLSIRDSDIQPSHANQWKPYIDKEITPRIHQPQYLPGHFALQTHVSESLT